MTEVTEQATSVEGCRLALCRHDATGEPERIDLGRVSHEAPPREWFDELPDEDVDGEWLAVELWEENATWRWPLDEWPVPRWVAEALCEGDVELDDRLEAAGVNVTPEAR